MNKFTFKQPFNEEDNVKLRAGFTQRFAEKIRQIRKSKGLRQTDVAELAGLHESYYGHIELCRFRPSFYVAWKIARALNTSLDDLTDF